ncbi:hypothetical protein G6F42_018371 [Rhizopus arrhizus]|nr:hypothetical protein G6F42_018371 [Rhizopus arrhizus]
MSFDKPTSVRQFLMNVPPPSKSVQDDHILDEMNKLYRQNLVQKAPVLAPTQAQPKPTTAQIILRNSLKESEKRKLGSENGPLSEIDPASDRLVAPVKKFKKPSCRTNTTSPVRLSSASAPASLPSSASPSSASSSTPTISAAPNEPGKVSQILTEGLTRRGSEPKKSPEKCKITPIDDILDSIFQSAEKIKAPSQSVTPPLVNNNSSKPASPPTNDSQTPKLNSPSTSISVSPNKQSVLPNNLNSANAIQAARSVAPWATTNQQPIHPQASMAPTSPALSPFPSPPLSAQQRDKSPVVPSSSSIAQSLHPRDKPKKISKNQQKKLRQAAKKAANAAKEHADNHSYNPNSIEDADFDTLLQLHEKSASAKSSDPENTKQGKNKNKKNKKKKNKALNSQVDLNQNQNNKDQAAKTGSTLPKQPGTSQKHDISQPSNQQQTAASIPNKNDNSNSNNLSIENIARQIIGAPKPIKRPNENSANQQNKRQKTKKEFVPLVTCRFFANGHCSNGDACTFKHDKDAVTAQPNPKKKIVCEFFKTGSCCKFDACPFSHDLKLEPCRFFHLNNNCKEANCPYSHDPLDADMLAKLRKLTGPCRYYHFKGVCNQG